VIGALVVSGVLAAPSIPLPAPAIGGRIAVAEALKRRRSVREFNPSAITAQELSQLLWAAQGITSADGKRTAPSAGALYPLELYVVAARVASIPAGIYHYIPTSQRIEAVTEGDQRKALSHAAFDQESIANAAAVIVIAAVPQRTAMKYGPRADRYVFIEAGCAAENLALQAVSMRLGTVVAGAFSDDSVRKLLGLGRFEVPLILMPVGHPLSEAPHE